MGTSFDRGKHAGNKKVVIVTHNLNLTRRKKKESWYLIPELVSKRVEHSLCLKLLNQDGKGDFNYKLNAVK